EDDEQRERDRRDAEPGGQDQEGNQRDEGRDHEHVAMGEVHHADDAVDHRIADGDQAVDRTKRDAVDELLDEIVHASARLSNPGNSPGKTLTGAWETGNAGAAWPQARTR